jgi:hypothetical protein
MKMAKKEDYPAGVVDYPQLCRSAWKKAKKHPGSRKLAIRSFCLLCAGGAPKEVKACVSEWCSLHQFRIGG